jgi:hypothetical protein
MTGPRSSSPGSRRSDLMTALDENLLWDVRAFVYGHFAATAQPPTADETAAHFQLTVSQAVDAYRELHQRHALFLEPGTASIRMANPFSAVPTRFRVHAQGRSYWANCAWDALGIPAALHHDADIEAACAESNSPVELAVRDARVIDHGERIHFAIPFRRWYDDLVFT